jgi:hypothetical protein
MTDARKSSLWSWAVVASTLVFLLLNFLIWFYNLNLLFMPYPNCGDLARIGMAPEIGQCREQKRTLPRLLQNPAPQQPSTFPILSFGDSISRGRGGGENNYWQDFVATRAGLDIAWVSEIDDNNYPQDIMRLRNSGYLKKLGVKYLVVQAAERAVVTRFTRDVNWDETMLLTELEARLHRLSGMLFTDERHIQAWEGQKLGRFHGGTELEARAMLTQFIFAHAGQLILGIDTVFEHVAKLSPEKLCLKRWKDAPGVGNPVFLCGTRPVLNTFKSIFSGSTQAIELHPEAQISFLADGFRTPIPAAINNNYKWLMRQLGNRFGTDKYSEAAQRWELKRPMFSGPHESTLLFHLGDYKSNRKNRDDNRISKMDDNLNRLAELLAQDGIRLYFMPTPNKLTVYQDYLAAPIETKSTFFPRLRELPGKKYIFIDTEKVISDMVARGEKDVYLIDDTHWSNKALPDIAKLFVFD